jgi:ribonuclease Z
MEKTKITFLGTGSAIPTARRNHPAVLLQFKDENILVDCGEGTQRQFRKAKLNPCKITKILITHWHGDHTLGLPGLLQTLTLNGYNKTLKIYGPHGTKENMENIINNFMKFYLKIAKQSGHPFKIEIHEINSDKPIDENEFQVKTAEMNHHPKTLAYSFIVKEKTRLNKQKLNKLKIPNSPLLTELAKGKTVTIAGKKINGKKISYQEPQRKITFILDTSLNEKAIKLAKNSDLIICEATYSSEQKKQAKEHFHLTSEQAAQIAKKSKSKKLILTHISQRYETKNQQKKLLQQAQKVFKNSEIVEDLDKIEI